MPSFIKFSVLLIPLFLLLSTSPVHASQSFEDWLEGFVKYARQQGISKSTLNEAVEVIEPIDRVIELDRKQPEGNITFEQYKQRVITKARVEQGRRMYHKYYKELKAVSNQFGVSPAYIVALWGIETSYGNNTGGFGVLSSLATLAWEGRRADFFRNELVEALRIIQSKHIDASHMKGSWAGAMGQNQFMPSSFWKFAYDYDHDGKKDIWNNELDVFASTANYLYRSGWHSGEKWGRPVVLPRKFPQQLIGLENEKELEEWRDMGITTTVGKPIPVVKGMKGALVAPDGEKGQVYLVYNNYRVFLKWNKSTYFATAVGLLADRITN